MHLPARYNIDIHDYSVRLKAAKKFLKAGDKVMREMFVQARDCVCVYFLAELIVWDRLFQVKIIVNLKGRENLYKKEAIELLRRFQNDVGEVIWP